MSKKMNILVILNIVGFIATIILNALANILPINGKNTGQLSDQYPNLFVPAGITFSIWGIIYILLAGFIIYQLITLSKKNSLDSGFISDIGIHFFISSAGNCAWILAWHYELVLISLVFMLVILFSLIKIYLNLRIALNQKPFRERIFTEIPFSIYLGWITIATIANITALLVNVQWNGFGIPEQSWTVLVLIAGILITGLILFLRKDSFYSFVVIWAFIGIILKRQADTASDDTAVLWTAVIGLIFIGIGNCILLITEKKHEKR